MGDCYLFAFIPAGPGYLIYSITSNAKSWLGAAGDIDRAIGTKAKHEIISSLGAGLDGDFFINTNKRIMWHDSTQENIESNVICASREHGISIATINWMEFMPDPTGYFCTTTKGECYWKNVPDTLDTHLRACSGNMWSLSVGKDGAWVTVAKSGFVTWCGVSESLVERLKQSHSGEIAYVNLCLNHDFWFIQYTNGSATWDTPQSWHENMGKYLNVGDQRWNRLVPWYKPPRTQARHQSHWIGKSLLKAVVGGIVKGVISSAIGQPISSGGYSGGGGSASVTFQQPQNLWDPIQSAASDPIQ